jgi:YggT family protein
MGALMTVFEFLLNLFFQIVEFLFMFRLFMRLVGIDPYHPMALMIQRATSPVVTPLMRVLPTIRQFETSTLVILLVLTMIKLVSEAALGGSPFPHLIGLTLWTVGDLTATIINFFFYLIVINALMSWIATGYNPATDVIGRLCEPLLRPARHFIPTLGGFDISPIIAIAVLMIVNYLIVQPWINVAVRLAF